MVALIRLEIAYGGVGLALRSEHFSGTMSPKEKAFWDKATAYFEAKNQNEGSPAVNTEVSASMRSIEEKMNLLSLS